MSSDNIQHALPLNVRVELSSAELSNILVTQFHWREREFRVERPRPNCPGRGRARRRRAGPRETRTRGGVSLETIVLKHGPRISSQSPMFF